MDNWARAGEKCQYITLSETEDELRASAASHGWSLEGIEIFELVPPELSLDPKQQQSLVYSSDLELGETVQMARIAGARVIWLAARVYRVGILMTGKKATFRDLWRWMRTA